MYTPDPINTQNVILPRDLKPLMEKLYRSNHDIWALQRIKEGWSYGPSRDDDKKQTPCLVPYDDLPESERDYDRKTSEETLKSIYKLGFAISKRAIGKIMLVGNYSQEDIDIFNTECSKFSLEMENYGDWNSAKRILERDLTKWNSIILDTTAKLEIGEEISPYFLRNVLDDLNSIFSKNRNEVPWFILPSDYDEKTTDLFIKLAVGREREDKGWGPVSFRKETEVKELFYNISEIIPNTRSYRIRCVYDEVFETLKDFFPDKTKDIITGILLPLHYPEVFYTFEATNYYNELRKALESIFKVCNEYGLIPADICFHENNNSVNLRYSCNYLISGDTNKLESNIGKGICPKSIALNLDHILNVANEGSHMGDSYITDGLYFSIESFSLQICDIIMWLGNYIRSNGLVAMKDIAKQYIGKSVPVKKDENGNYYFEKCLFRDIPKITKANEKNTLVKIKNVIRNTRYTKNKYPFFAYI